MESDAAMTEDLIAYNIIPLDTPTTTNAIVSLPEVSGLVWLISGTCIIFGGNLFPVEFIFRFKLQFPLWSTSEAYQNCRRIYLYLLKGMLICLTFCSMFLDFRFVLDSLFGFGYVWNCFSCNTLQHIAGTHFTMVHDIAICCSFFPSVLVKCTVFVKCHLKLLVYFPSLFLFL